MKCSKCGNSNPSDESFGFERPMQSYYYFICKCGNEEKIPIDNSSAITQDWYLIKH